MYLKKIIKFLFIRTKKWKAETDEDWDIVKKEYGKFYNEIDINLLKEIDKSLGSETLIKDEGFSFFAWAYNIQELKKYKNKRKEKNSNYWWDLVEENDDPDMVESLIRRARTEDLNIEKREMWENISKDEALNIVSINGADLEFLSVQYKKSKDIVLEAVKNYGRSLSHAHESLQSNKEIVLEAVRQNGYALGYADNSLKNDREVVLEAAKQNGHAIEGISNNLKEDREIALTAILSCAEGEEACLGLDEYTDKKFKKDKDFMLKVVSVDGSSLACADDTLRIDKDIVRAAAKNNGFSFGYAHESLRSDRDFVLEIVKENGEALHFASSMLKKDKEIILAAISKHPHFLSYADEELQKDEDILRAIEVVKNKVL